MIDSTYPDLKAAVSRIMGRLNYGAILSTREIRDDLEEMGFAVGEHTDAEIVSACRSLIREGKPMAQEYPGFWCRLR